MHARHQNKYNPLGFDYLASNQAAALALGVAYGHVCEVVANAHKKKKQKQKIQGDGGGSDGGGASSPPPVVRIEVRPPLKQ